MHARELSETARAESEISNTMQSWWYKGNSCTCPEYRGDSAEDVGGVGKVAHRTADDSESLCRQMF
jgi:hypothetical protein